MEKVKKAGQAGAVSGDAALELPASIPVIEGDELDGAVRRSARARRLHARLQARAEEGRPLGAREVDDIVRGCKRSDGKPDGDQAVVLAEHARRHPATFGGGHGGLLRFLARVAWPALIRDLRMFITKVREREAEERKREALRLDLEQDRVEHDARKHDVLRKDGATDAQPPPVNERLDADNRLRFTLERLKRT